MAKSVVFECPVTGKEITIAYTPDMFRCPSCGELHQLNTAFYEASHLASKGKSGQS